MFALIKMLWHRLFACWQEAVEHIQHSQIVRQLRHLFLIIIALFYGIRVVNLVIILGGEDFTIDVLLGIGVHQTTAAAAHNLVDLGVAFREYHGVVVGSAEIAGDYGHGCDVFIVNWVAECGWCVDANRVVPNRT
jgi:hypothetical protein